MEKKTKLKEIKLTRFELDKKCIISGALLLVIGNILGAMGAHLLKKLITADQLEIFFTGTQYQMYHSLGLLLLGILRNNVKSTTNLDIAFVIMLLGITFFSGSLYLLATININGLKKYVSIIGPITPLGGVCFVLSWCFVIASVF